MSTPEETPRRDTLPEWLYQRFCEAQKLFPWDELDEDTQAYWVHQAHAVRRAVARNGFKEPRPDQGTPILSLNRTVYGDCVCGKRGDTRAVHRRDLPCYIPALPSEGGNGDWSTSGLQVSGKLRPGWKPGPDAMTSGE